MIVWAYESEVHAVHSGYIVYYSISHSLYIPSQFRASLAQLKQSAIRRAARYIAPDAALADRQRAPERMSNLGASKSLSCRQAAHTQIARPVLTPRPMQSTLGA